MEFRPLEINVKSAKELKDVNIFFKMDVYVVVSINGDPRTAQKTPVDKDCGPKPKWNYTMKFTVDEAAVRQNSVNLVFYLKSERVFGDRDIGAVQVPVKELLDDHNLNGTMEGGKLISYSVRLPNGKPKGVLDFSYKFGEKFSNINNNIPVPRENEAMYVTKHEEKPAMSPSYPPPQIAYPGTSSGYGYQTPPPQMAGGYSNYHHYHHHPPPGYPQYGYQQQGFAAPGYGYPGYPPPNNQGGGYGYLPPQKPKKSRMGGAGAGAGLGLGLAGGLLGGMLIGDMVEDAYDGGSSDWGGGF